MSYRRRQVVSLFGALRVRRAYYHCRHCGHGCTPRDALLGLTSRALTPAAQELAALAGALGSFGEAAQKTLPRMCGLRLSESTVERTTEDAGERWRRLLDERQTLGESSAWDWQRDAHGRTCAYVSLDATGVRQQGPRGAHADGRMATVGMIYNPRGAQDRGPEVPGKVRYLAGFYDFQRLGPQLRRQAAQVGWDQAEQQIALSDGGAGLEEFLRVYFPRATRILDFWHAKEHLVELAQAWFAEEPARQRWLGEQCQRLKHEGGAAVLAVLEQLDLEPASTAAREALRTHLGYFRNHVPRMDYPTYVANGWQIGSGPVESACKTVIGNRLKGGGMRWGEPGSDHLCALRALWLGESSQWKTFWTAHPN